MKIQQIQLNPDPYKPFRLAQGYRVGDLLYISGQAAINESGQIVGNDFAAQGDQAFANLDKVLKAGGSSLKNVVKVTIFVRDMASNFSKVVDLRGKYFTPPYPADTIVEITSLYSSEALIEIEAVAVVDEAVER